MSSNSRFARRFLALLFWIACGSLAATAAPPTPIVFDTDMGNDIDDALALGVIHALQSRGECQLLAVTLSKDHPSAAPFVDLVNTFYGRGDTPIGVVRDGKTPEPSPYIEQPAAAKINGAQRWPHDLTNGADAPEAVALLRKTLAAQPDQSVVLVVVGFSTNIARLLDSPADQYSPLGGRELCAQKVRQLSMMAGMFSTENRVKEYNVFVDEPAARKIFAEWPGELVASGFEIGSAIKFPAMSIQNDFRYADHPLAEAYGLYQKMPYDRETWDLTSVLYAVRPDRDYFGISPRGEISVDEHSVTQFSPTEAGRRRYLTLSPQQAIAVREVLIGLASQPPTISAK